MKPPHSDDTTFTITGRVTDKDRLNPGPSTTWHPSTDDGGASGQSDENTTRGRSSSAGEITSGNFPISNATYKKVVDELEVATSRITCLEAELKEKETGLARTLAAPASGLTQDNYLDVNPTETTARTYMVVIDFHKRRIRDLERDLKSRDTEITKLRAKIDLDTQCISRLDSEVEMLQKSLESAKSSNGWLHRLRRRKEENSSGGDD